MSVQTISKYYTEIQKYIRFGGTSKESSIRRAFENLLNEYAQQQNLLLIAELDYRTPKGTTVSPDGTLKDALRLDWGYWESKDTDDDLEVEIEKKFKKGYPSSNILFEDTQTVILYQNGVEVERCKILDAEALHRVISRFTNFTRAEVRSFRDAIEKFKADLPQVLDTLRKMIAQQAKDNKPFVIARDAFLELCKHVINENVTLADVNEMLIQHILTEEIFTTVFDDPQFHQENNISKELGKLEHTFFTGKTKHDTLDSIKIYYQMIKARAGEIASHTEKQKFLKVIYENFYKAYNPKGADRLGIIYTPDEIVRFMIESTDFLLHKHFGKLLSSKNVEILDPATGTGTFICDIIDHLPENDLKYKYQNEIHCNEIAILPYYIANLNIEATYKQKMGVYEEFKNICFVDTLDNMGFAYDAKDKNGKMLFSLSSENSERIKAQNKRKISVIIGNPPYNANQANENDNNKNRKYPIIDKRIKDTFIKYSRAQKTKAYDPCSRFFRLAMDRIAKNGIIAFIINRTFLDSTSYDGWRKCVRDDFSDIYVIDTKSDVRDNPKISGTKHNVFGIQTGVAIIFLVKKENESGNANIRYFSLTDEQTRKEKLDFFNATKLKSIDFEYICPDRNNNWINLSDNNFDDLIPVIDKKTKSGLHDHALFVEYSTGISTNRDEWVIDFSKASLSAKIRFFAEFYNAYKHSDDDDFDTTIKWSRNLKRRFEQGKKERLSADRIIRFNYRPFAPTFLYNSDIFVDEHGLSDQIFQNGNSAFCISGSGASKTFQALAVNSRASLDYLEKTQIVPFYFYDTNGNRLDNITDWGLKQFQERYENKKITKEDIFYYVYAVLHNPAYRKKYEMNLKREFPRIPFYDDFKQWSKWGKTLMDLHINFETAAPLNLKCVEKVPPKQKQSKSLDVVRTNQLPESKRAEHSPKPRLKADKEHGSIELDDLTTLTGVPKEAWEYKLGNRSALEWVLDQYKEYKPSDPTIAEKFNTYRFADYKEKVIDLLKRVCTVSVKTMEIIRQMK
ncbi:MAG: type ISP restriction/modification enzyme [Phycisphaerae bacterium]|jgi:predicted helicase